MSPADSPTFFRFAGGVPAARLPESEKDPGEAARLPTTGTSDPAADGSWSPAGASAVGCTAGLCFFQLFFLLLFGKLNFVKKYFKK